MFKHIIIIVFVLNSILVSAQTNLRIPNQIEGKIIGKPLEIDSIYFSFGSIDSKYYENALASLKLTSNQYVGNNQLSYPQMYRIYFATDRNIRTWRSGIYFIDSTTTTIKTNYLSDNCSEINGTTANEYQTIFIPFITKGIVYDCKSNDLRDLLNSQNKKIDTLLFNYVIQNPSSYVALWELIERFSMWGQSEVRQKTLANFSSRIKSEKIWKILNEDFKNTKIKEKQKYPVINVKTYNLTTIKLSFPKAKYTLVDYWFCRCRPCLDTIPIMKKLYADYKDKGFNIVSISVDETKNVPLWQNRVKEHGLVWTQYLEENNFKVNELGIKAYPTFILLDSQGKVLWRDFDLHDLNNFLRKNL